MRSPSKQIKSQLPTKLSLGSHKASRFSDSEPGSSSPLQRLPTKFASGGSGGPQKTPKPNRLNAARVAGNGVSRSASSLTDLKKEDISHELKAVSIRTRRLLDPKGSNGHHATLKFGVGNTLSKTKLPVEPEINKISAIMSLDRTKSATLPELKIKTSRSNSDIIQNNSAAKEIKQKNNGNGSSLTPESIKSKKINEKAPHITSVDDNPVIEKTVVMLEHDVHAVPVVQTSEDKIKDKRGAHADGSIRTAMGVTEYAAIRAPASAVIISEVDTNPSQFQFDVHPSSNEVCSIKQSLMSVSFIIFFPFAI